MLHEFGITYRLIPTGLPRGEKRFYHFQIVQKIAIYKICYSHKSLCFSRLRIHSFADILFLNRRVKRRVSYKQDMGLILLVSICRVWRNSTLDREGSLVKHLSYKYFFYKGVYLLPSYSFFQVCFHVTAFAVTVESMLIGIVVDVYDPY